MWIYICKFGVALLWLEAAAAHRYFRGLVCRGVALRRHYHEAYVCHGGCLGVVLHRHHHEAYVCEM